MISNRWERFNCKRCGLCCEKIGLPWPSGRLEEIADFLNTNPEEIITKYYGEILWENGERYIKKYIEDKRTPCPFLGNDRTCSIYLVRPDGCRKYPIETDCGRCGVDCPGMKELLTDESNFEMDPLKSELELIREKAKQ